MNTTPLVSILVPIYGVEKYIVQCANSLFCQTYKNIEFIFVDDCTKDNSVNLLMSVIKKYSHLDSRIKLIRHSKNLGLAAARNTAVDNSSGIYIMHVDSDDYLEDNAVELLIEKATEENSDLVISDYMQVYKHKSNILRANFNSNSLEYTKLLLTRRAAPNIIGKLIRKTIVIDNNLKAEPGLNQGEDYMVLPKISYNSEVISYVNFPLYNYRKDVSTSYTANLNLNGVESICKVEDNLINYFKNVFTDTKDKDILLLSQLYNKITLYYGSNFDAYPYISSLYKDIEYMHTPIPLRFKVILKLGDWNFLRFIYISTKIFRCLSK